jgi:Ca2+-transporting ATPase
MIQTSSPSEVQQTACGALEIEVSEQGLSRDEAHRRLIQDGPNKLPEVKPEHWVFIFLRQFQNPLIFVLLLAGAVVLWMGEVMDGGIIFGVLFFNALVGALQEGRAQNIFLALKRFVQADASVVREGKEMIVTDEEVVTGDIIVLREGEKVPADARLLYTEDFRVDESALTGESSPKFKSADLVSSEDMAAAERRDMVFKGTNVVAGMARAVVVATGSRTIIGSITAKILGIDEELPLKEDIRRMSRLILWVVAGVNVVILGLGTVFYDYPLGELLSTVVAVAVSVIPEGLPIVVTLVLATGVWRMGRRNVLVKKLHAVEALGQTSVIAVDKTGTLTKNELTVKEIFAGGKKFTVTGDGYRVGGDIRLEGQAVEPLNRPELLEVGKMAAWCSSAHIAFSQEAGVWKVSGDPTEAATLVLARKIGFRKEILEADARKKDEHPFSHELRYHAVLYAEGDGTELAIVGAPEAVLARCERVWQNEQSEALLAEDRNRIEGVFVEMSARGLRVIALAKKTLDPTVSHIPDQLDGLVFVGLLGLQDALREGVVEVSQKVREGGINLVMITGDHEVTARSIGVQAGIFRSGDRVLLGAEVDSATEIELAKKLHGVSVFARISPMSKLKIIDAYKARGEVVAMTGDGINDALSLTSADVGVAMGKIGTEVAKEASDIVLLDDNFGSLLAGIEEGRRVYRTIKKVILYLFSTSIGEVVVVLGAMVAGYPLPLLATQIVWLNLVTDGFLDIALAMEPENPGPLGRRMLRGGKWGLVDSAMIQRMLLMAVVMAAGTLGMFIWYYEHETVKAWTVSLTTLAVFQWFNAWNCRSHIYSVFGKGGLANRFLVAITGGVVVLQLLAVYHPFLQAMLRTVPLSLRDWLMILPVASSIFIVEEVRKWRYRRKKRRSL